MVAALAGRVLSAQELMNNQRTQEGKDLLPLAYIHIPKTGTSFATTIAHYGCPRIPEDVMVQEVSVPSEGRDSFQRRYPFEEWCQGSFLLFRSGHRPVRTSGSELTPLKSVVALFRLPKPRIVSGYFHNFHDCREMRLERECSKEDGPCQHLYETPMEEQEKQILEYSRCIHGCMVHMLTDNACGAEGSKEKKQGRLKNLQQGARKAVSEVPRLGFVGLTEQFPLSICLFHARFGGRCYRASFLNNRPSVPTATKRYDQFLKLIASEDTSWDDAVYEAAATRFWREIRLYNVTNELCRTRVCPEAPEFFPD